MEVGYKVLYMGYPYLFVCVCFCWALNTACPFMRKCWKCYHTSYSLNSSRGGYIGEYIIWGGIIGVIKRDTRSLDSSSHNSAAAEDLEAS